MRTIDSYIKRSYSGNLLELLDAMDWLSRWLHIPNKKLPADFFSVLVSCPKDCTSCTRCEDILRAVGRQKALLG